MEGQFYIIGIAGCYFCESLLNFLKKTKMPYEYKEVISIFNNIPKYKINDYLKEEIRVPVVYYIKNDSKLLLSTEKIRELLIKYNQLATHEKTETWLSNLIKKIHSLL